ncbi:MAG TPA: hypothetical protein VGC34_09465, partial [Steroidobacteraceae bacterium]
MQNNLSRRCQIAAAVALLLANGAAHAAPVATFAPDGTAHIVDLTVPIPTTLSPEARAMLQASAAAGDPTHGLTLALQQMRAANDAHQEKTTQRLLQMYRVKVEKKTLGGVPVALITPPEARAERKDRLLLNVHGGAFFLGKVSIIEAI